jgi:hypothetical protein
MDTDYSNESKYAGQPISTRQVGVIYRRDNGKSLSYFTMTIDCRIIAAVPATKLCSAMFSFRNQ